MAPDIRVLYDEATIAERIDALAEEIKGAGRPDLLVIAVLKGSFVFAADLIRAMHHAGLAPEIEFIHLSSYGAGTTSSGEVKILRDVDNDVTGRNVLLVDDILESGRTLAFAKDLMRSRGASTVEVVALLDKPENRVADIHADYRGFECPDKFVIGYGMDMGHAWRQLPYIGYVVQEDEED